MMATDPSTIAVAQAAQQIALQMLEERGRGAVLVGVARVDAALEHLLQAVMAPATDKKDGLFLPDRPLGSLGSKVALASRLGLIDPPIERALNALRKLRNAFAHSTETASLDDPAHRARLQEVYKDARANPLWGILEPLLADHVPKDPSLRDYILLITILVAFLEATAQQLSPQPPAVVMGFEGIQSPRSEPNEHA